MLPFDCLSDTAAARTLQALLHSPAVQVEELAACPPSGLRLHVDGAAARHGRAAEAAEHREQAAVRLLARLLVLLVPLVDEVRGDAEDCQGDDGARRAAADGRAEVLVWVGDVHADLLADLVTGCGDLPLRHTLPNLADLVG